MMKYIKIILTTLLSLILTSGTPLKSYRVTLYSPQKSASQLQPCVKTVQAAGNFDLCTQISDELLNLQKTPGTAVLLPKDFKISVSGNNANVDFSEVPNFSKDYDTEMLTIYSIVNSITSSGDIVTVTFTVNGRKIKSFNGTVDMTETFIPNYEICS